FGGGLEQVEEGAAWFIRGDANSDALVDISDCISVLGFLFLGDAPPACSDSADVNDDGEIDISDPVYLLGYLFLGATAPTPPYPEAGTDATDDELLCSDE
ncbi:MAG TPA: hypothetical protein VFD71_19515, partial [Planctomycetota bacterium]|nr:hypothetical protein [Planctomycetota bacterium]